MTRTVGVLGAGQLGRMLALAGAPLGMHFVFLDPKADSPASRFGEHHVAPYTDAAGLEALAQCDVVTYEFESVPVEAVDALAGKVAVYPPPRALSVARDRLEEKRLFTSLGIPTPRYLPIATQQALDLAVREVGLPCVLKTRTLGYDGKGQLMLRSESDVPGALERLGGKLAIVERFVEFERELSQVAVRDRDGTTAFYPLIENSHEGGILRTSRCPVLGATSEHRAAARDFAARLLRELDYVGVLALEMFQVGRELWANEVAPRVHNSAHLSIEGAETSQFENHLRAIAGLPLGSTAVRVPTTMVNCVGRMPSPKDVLAVTDAHLHDYDKEPRAGRKVGHVTVRGESDAALSERVEALLAVCPFERE
ncbi:MAG: 5-(carboxyamino)imidazole ribonucleotide synthase [Polyangiaceae bacterium]